MTPHPERVERVGRPDGSYIEARVYNLAARRTVVLSNGLGCGDVLFRYLIDDLATDHRVVTWDYRGHGGSSEADGPEAYTLSAHAADLAAIQSAVGAGSATHLGFGLGALVALEHHSWSPESVEALVLIQGGLPRGEGRLPLPLELTRGLLSALAPLAPLGAKLLLRGGSRRQIQALARRGGVVGRTLGADDFQAMIASLARGRWSSYREVSRALSSHKPADPLGQVKVPTLVFGASRDLLCPEVLMQQVHESLHNSEYVRLPGAGRTCLLELGPVIAARTRRFLEERRRQQPWKEQDGEEG